MVLLARLGLPGLPALREPLRLLLARPVLLAPTVRLGQLVQQGPRLLLLVLLVLLAQTAPLVLLARLRLWQGRPVLLVQVAQLVPQGLILQSLAPLGRLALCLQLQGLLDLLARLVQRALRKLRCRLVQTQPWKLATLVVSLSSVLPSRCLLFLRLVKR